MILDKNSIQFLRYKIMAQDYCTSKFFKYACNYNFLKTLKCTVIFTIIRINTGINFMYACVN